MTEQTEELAKENRCSIEVSKNAKGEYSWKIKIYFEDEKADTPTTRLKAIDEDLRVLFK